MPVAAIGIVPDEPEGNLNRAGAAGTFCRRCGMRLDACFVPLTGVNNAIR
jgi:hypothetical protein